MEDLPILRAVDFGTHSLSTLADIEIARLQDEASKQTSLKKKSDLNMSLVEIKKKKRLIRNRFSAQLHRERKEYQMRKLEFDVAERVLYSIIILLIHFLDVG